MQSEHWMPTAWELGASEGIGPSALGPYLDYDHWSLGMHDWNENAICETCSLHMEQVSVLGNADKFRRILPEPEAHYVFSARTKKALKDRLVHALAGQHAFPRRSSYPLPDTCLTCELNEQEVFLTRDR